MPKAKKASQAFRYRGLLAKPLPYEPHWTAIRTFSGLLALASMHTPELRHPTLPRSFPTDLQDRIAALYEEHGVAYGDDDALLFALVTTHVPGLSVERANHGPAPVWTPRRRAELRIAVDQHKAADGKRLTVSAACMHLAAKEPWESRLRTTKNRGRALRQQYDLAEDVWVAVVRSERAYEQWKKEHPEEVDRQRRSRRTELLRLIWPLRAGPPPLE
jgi:hypothetical protein